MAYVHGRLQWSQCAGSRQSEVLAPLETLRLKGRPKWRFQRNMYNEGSQRPLFLRVLSLPLCAAAEMVANIWGFVWSCVSGQRSAPLIWGGLWVFQSQSAEETGTKEGKDMVFSIERISLLALCSRDDNCLSSLLNGSFSFHVGSAERKVQWYENVFAPWKISFIFADLSHLKV